MTSSTSISKSSGDSFSVSPEAMVTTNRSASFLSRRGSLIFGTAALYLVFSVLLTLSIYRLIYVVTHQQRRLPSRSQAKSHTRIAQKPNIPTPANTDADADATPPHRGRGRGHLLIVLGSGGHTAEMLAVLSTLGPEYLNTRFGRRTWVVSSGDWMSGERARRFEEKMRDWDGLKRRMVDGKGVEAENKEQEQQDEEVDTVEWDIVTVTRARNVHQSLLTTPLSALRCLWDCVSVLRAKGPLRDLDDPKSMKNQRGRGGGEDTQKRQKEEDAQKRVKKKEETQPHAPLLSQKADQLKVRSRYPDLILTNGPGTGVMVVLASLLLKFFGLAPVSSDFELGADNQREKANTKAKAREEGGAMRSIYIESWARVKTLSLSGKILRFMVGRFLVQWRGLADADLTLTNEASTGDGNGDGGASISLWSRKTEYVGPVVA